MNQTDGSRNAPPAIIAILIGLVRPDVPRRASVDQQNDVAGFAAQPGETVTTGERDAALAGTLMCGADGALYFIPDRDLAAYRLAEEEAGQVRTLLADRSNVDGFAMGQSSPITTLLPASPDASAGFYDLLISSVKHAGVRALDGASKEPAY